MRYCFLLVLSVLYSVKCYEILGIFPNQGDSHFRVFAPLVRSLADRGHNVTVLSHSVLKNPPPTYKGYNISNEKALRNVAPFESQGNIFLRQIYEAVFLADKGLDSCEHILNHELTKKVMSGELRFDLILAEQFHTDCAFVFLHKLKVPFVAFSSDTLFPFMFPRAGIPNNPSYIPNHALDYGRHLNFFQRTLSAVSILLNKFFYNIRQWRTDRLISKYIYNTPSLEALIRNVSLVFINAHPVLYGSDPVPANVIFLGGIHLSHRSSTMTPKKRVSFHDPPVSATKYIERPQSPLEILSKFKDNSFKSPKPKSKMKKLDSYFADIVPLNDNPIVSEDDTMTSTTPLEKSQSQIFIANAVLNNEEPFYPDLVNCCDPISNITDQLTSPLWENSVKEEFQGKVNTIGEFASLTEFEINRLSIKSPKLSVARSVLSAYFIAWQERQLPNSDVETGPIVTPKISEFDALFVNYSYDEILDQCIKRKAEKNNGVLKPLEFVQMMSSFAKYYPRYSLDNILLRIATECMNFLVGNEI